MFFFAFIAFGAKSVAFFFFCNKEKAISSGYGDVCRTPEEFSAGHVVGAINIPYMYRVGSGYSHLFLHVLGNLPHMDSIKTSFSSIAYM